MVELERNKIYDLLDFLESNKIRVAYSNIHIAMIGTYLSEGKINISEFYNNPAAKTQKKLALKFPYFAIIIYEKNTENIYRKYLLENKIKFKFEEVGEYKIYREFSGDPTQINNLRFLITQ